MGREEAQLAIARHERLQIEKDEHVEHRKQLAATPTFLPDQTLKVELPVPESYGAQQADDGHDRPGLSSADFEEKFPSKGQCVACEYSYSLHSVSFVPDCQR